MSTFKGPIKELQYVSVDNFEPQNFGSTTYFLSHCHVDHMKGLQVYDFIAHLRGNPSFRLYCSEISRRILSTYVKLADIMSQIEDLVIMEPYSINVPPRTSDGLPYRVTVTCIPAGHCPGAVMFMFETPQYRIIYSGDFRYSVGDTAKIKKFHVGPYVLPIDKIYLDCTFFSPNYMEFPTREESIELIVKKVEQWLKQNEKNNVQLLMPANYGGEYIMERIAIAMQCQVHVPNFIYDMFSHVREFSSYITKECSTTRIHVSVRTKDGECLTEVKTIKRENILNIFIKAAPFECGRRGLVPMLINNSTGSLTVNYSSHSSYSEVMDFLQHLKPREIHDCTGVVRRGEVSSVQLADLLESLTISWKNYITPKYQIPLEKQSLSIRQIKVLHRKEWKPEYDLLTKMRAATSLPDKPNVQSENKSQDLQELSMGAGH